MVLTNVRIVLIDRIIEKGFIRFEDGIIKDIQFDGVACTISTASTSMMSDLLIGKTLEEANKVIECDEFEFDIVKNDVKAYYFEKIRNKTADVKEEMIAIQLKSGKPYALIGEKEKVNILRFLQKGKL